VESSIDVTFPTASLRQKSDHGPATRCVKTFTTQIGSNAEVERVRLIQNECARLSISSCRRRSTGAPSIVWRVPADPQQRLNHIYARQGVHPEEVRLAAEPITGWQPGGGTNMGYELALASGEKAYFKPINGIDVNIANAYGHDAIGAVFHEAVAWQLARALGAPYDQLVAPCILRVIPAIDTNPGAMSAWRGDPLPLNADFLALFPFDPLHAAAAAFFDSLIGQQDRNVGNVRVEQAPQRLHLIDQGYSFPRRADDWNATPFSAIRGVVHSVELDAAEIAALQGLLASGDLLGARDALEDDRGDALERRAAAMLAPCLLPVGSF
jgi:hypothetical protein